MSLRSVVVSSYRGALPTLLLSGVGGLLAGSLLGGMNTELQAVQGLLVMVPAFLAIRGSVYGSLGSRLSSGLHQGLIDPAFEYDARVLKAVVAALLNGVIASLFAAGLTYWLLTVLNRDVAPLWILVFIGLVGGLLAGVILTGIIVSVVVVGYRRGLDPDNLIGPVMTTAGDIFGMATLFFATRLALSLI